jgi:hypothetical protein
MEECPDCDRFYREQLHFKQWLDGTIVDVAAPPLQGNWEDRVAGRSPGWRGFPSNGWMHFFQAVQLRYVLVATGALILVSGVLLNLDGEIDIGMTYLAQLDAYHFESQSNPFLPDVGEQNPFFQLGNDLQLNPFASRQ